MDRGFFDYGLFSKWTKAGISFVTRMKDRVPFEDVEIREVPKRGNICMDPVIRLSSDHAKRRYPDHLRLIGVWDDDKKDVLVLLTNHMDFGATTISRIYKDRWQIELFFKALKQNLRIKTFVGTSANALKTQIWTALIAMLLLKFLQMRARFKWALSNLVAMLRWNLFTYRDLWEWIDRPYETPQLPPGPKQLVFAFANLGQHRRQT